MRPGAFVVSLCLALGVVGCSGPTEPRIGPSLAVGCVEDKPEEGGCPAIYWTDSEDGLNQPGTYVGPGTSCELSDPDCDLRSLNIDEWMRLYQAVTHMRGAARDWAMYLLSHGQVWAWDHRFDWVENGVVRTMMTDVHLDPAGSSGASVHFWSGNIAGRSLMQLVASWCHEAVHALRDEKQHTDAFWDSVNQCITSAVW